MNSTYQKSSATKPETAISDIGKRFPEGKLVGVKVARIGEFWSETREFEPVKSTAEKVSKLLSDAGIKHSLIVDGELATVEFADSYV